MQSWLEKVNRPLLARLEGGVLNMAIDTVDVVGSKAIVEASGSATQKSGKPYNNR